MDAVLDEKTHRLHLALARAWVDHRLADMPAERRELEALSVCGLIDGAWYRGAFSEADARSSDGGG